MPTRRGRARPCCPLLTVAYGLELESTLQRIVTVATELVDARYGALGVLGSDNYLARFVHVGIDQRTRATMGIDKHPSAVLAGTRLWLFRQTYDPADAPAQRHWRIAYATRTGTGWSVPQLFGDPITERQLPTAAADGTGGRWLFWRERAGGTWQLRYNRHGGNDWQLATPQTFPPDGTQDPRVEDDLYVLVRPGAATGALWVFWSRQESGGPPGQTRRGIAYRVKAQLDPTVMDWSPVRTVPKSGAGAYHDRHPYAIPGGGAIELVWSTTRDGGPTVVRNTLDPATLTWGTPQTLVGGPYAARARRRWTRGGGTALVVYRSNRSMAYDVGALHTLDQTSRGVHHVHRTSTAKHRFPTPNELSETPMPSTAVAPATISVGQAPTGVAISPDGRHAYITNQNSANVSVIDTVRNTITAAVSVGSRPFGVTTTPDGRHAYVTNFGSNTVSVIDTLTNTVATTIPVGSFPGAVAITPAGRHAYVTNFGSNTVSVIDTLTNTVITTIPVGNTPNGVAITPDGRHAYVTNQNSGNVSVIDTATTTVTMTITVGGLPSAVAITPDGRNAYITNIGMVVVSVIDAASNTISAIISAGGSSGVAITPDGRHAYITNFGSGTAPGTATAIDTATNTVVTSVLAGKGAFRVAVAPDGRHAYIANQEEATVSVIRTLPLANSIAPVQGLATSTTQVKISGTRLDGATAVNFGPNPATNLVANAAGTELTATSPTGNPGTVPVTVTTPGGTSKPVSFTYGVPPTISAIVPTQGPVNGGTEVTITGTGLSGVTAVNFGPNTATNPVANAAGTELSAISPAGASGVVSVTVTTPGGTSNPVAFTYLIPPAISTIDPAQGPASGGTEVIINGTRLSGAAAVHFGQNPATNVFSTSGAGIQLLATSPAGAPGTVPVTVTTPDGTSNASPYLYT